MDDESDSLELELELELELVSLWSDGKSDSSSGASRILLPIPACFVAQGMSSLSLTAVQCLICSKSGIACSACIL